MFALIYMGVLPGFYLAIRRWHSAWVVAAIILITKSCDIGAYFAGRAFGRHKLVPWLSPGKTWEGLIGGVLTSAAVATAFAAMGNALGLSGHFNAESAFVQASYPLGYVAVCGVLIGLIGQVGDLAVRILSKKTGSDFREGVTLRSC